jgi:hypothetical protein
MGMGRGFVGQHAEEVCWLGMGTGLSPQPCSKHKITSRKLKSQVRMSCSLTTAGQLSCGGETAGPGDEDLALGEKLRRCGGLQGRWQPP